MKFNCGGVDEQTPYSQVPLEYCFKDKQTARQQRFCTKAR